MTGRFIDLLRHGPVDCPHERMRQHELAAWSARYDAAGLRPGAEPPPGLRESLAGARAVFCSDLLRSRESSARLFPDREPAAHGDFREVPLSLPPRLPGRLPVAAWDVLARLLPIRTAEPHRAALARGRRAAARLVAAAEVHGHVVLVGHGWFNFYLGRALRERGYRGPRWTGARHWTWARFTVG